MGPARYRGEQRGDDAAGADRRGGYRGLAADGEHQPDGAALHDARGAADHAGAGRRAYRQCLVGGGAHGAGGQRRL